MRYPWRLICDVLWPEPNSIRFSTGQVSRFKNTLYLLSYKNKTVKEAIRNNKFHHHKQSAQQLAISCDVYFKKYNDLTIIPIPSSRVRRRTRGFEHLLRIMEYSQHKQLVRVDILQKSKHTKPQSHVDKKTRVTQQLNAFTCNVTEAAKLSGTIILLDDVVTTESTMSAARVSLTPHLTQDAKLICLAIAH